MQGSGSTGVSASPRPLCAAVVGLQWGDEGKGKIVDRLAPGHAAVVRYNGGANAGHTIEIGGERYALHLTPSGILHKGALAVVANGVVVDPSKLLEELDALASRGVDVSGLRVSDRAHVVMPYHKAEDELRESILSGADLGPSAEDRSIGTTRRGIGPAYAEKAQRAGAVRIGDLVNEAQLRERVSLACAMRRRVMGDNLALNEGEMVAEALRWGERLRPYIADTVYEMHELLAENKPLLFEGANATLLDVDHGTFPFVTSSSCSALGVASGSGVSERWLGRVIGVVKAYQTRVGAGPMPTEDLADDGKRLREQGNEYGTTTGRPRRTGWIDLVALRYAAMLNGTTELAVTKLDVLAGFPEIRACVGYATGGERTTRFPPDAARLRAAKPEYERIGGFTKDELASARTLDDLPAGAKRLMALIEEWAMTPVTIVGVGAERDAVLTR